LGIITGGFYCHNISLPIYRDNKQPEHNVRDMFFGFTVVAISYIICGVLGSIGFSNTNLFGKEVKVEQNFLLMFESDNYFAMFIRCCSFM